MLFNRSFLVSNDEFSPCLSAAFCRAEDCCCSCCCCCCSCTCSRVCCWTGARTEERRDDSRLCSVEMIQTSTDQQQSVVTKASMQCRTTGGAHENTTFCVRAPMKHARKQQRRTLADVAARSRADRRTASSSFCTVRACASVRVCVCVCLSLSRSRSLALSLSLSLSLDPPPLPHTHTRTHTLSRCANDWKHHSVNVNGTMCKYAPSRSAHATSRGFQSRADQAAP